MNTPTLESAVEASHQALARILTGDQSGYLALFSSADDVTLGNPFGPFGRGRQAVEARLAVGASKYREGRNTKVELIEQYVSDKLACVAEVESGEAKVAGSETFTTISTSHQPVPARDWSVEAGASPRRPAGHAAVGALGEDSENRTRKVFAPQQTKQTSESSIDTVCCHFAQ